MMMSSVSGSPEIAASVLVWMPHMPSTKSNTTRFTDGVSTDLLLLRARLCAGPISASV